jgi:hypothetical protein
VSDEQKPPQPPEKPTQKLEAMTDRKLLEDLFRLTKEQDKKIDTIVVNQDLLVGTVDSLKVDVRHLQQWKLDSEERQSTHSGGIRNLSSTDSKHEAAQSAMLATQIDHSAQLEHQTLILNEHTAAHAASGARLEKVEKKVETVLTETQLQTAIMTKLVDHPLVKKIAWTAGGLILTSLLVLAAMMKGKLETIEHKPAMTAPAPTVYLPITSFDGGVK